MAVQGFGKPKVGGGGNYAKEIKLKENTTVVARIIPPIKVLAETGEWAVYQGVHFGYKGVNQKDPSKPSFRPFKCIRQQDFRTKMITRECPECNLIAEQEAALQKAVDDYSKEMDAKGKPKYTSEQIEEMVGGLKQWLQDHNVDRKWYINVLTQQGEFSILKLSHRTKKQLDEKIAQVLSEDGVDAFDPDSGVWFKFSRTGRGIETRDNIDFDYESVRENGKVVKTLKLAPMTEAQQAQVLKDGTDLASYLRELTEEQIALLTKSSGDPDEVDSILALGAAKKTESSPKPQAARYTTPVVSKPVTAAKAETKAPPAEPEVDEEEAALMAALAEKRAAKAAKQAEAQRNPEPEASPEPVSEPTSAPAASSASPEAGIDPMLNVSNFRNFFQNKKA